MPKTLSVQFEGLVAVIPQSGFSAPESPMVAFVRQLREPAGPIAGHHIDSHLAYLQIPYDPEPASISDDYGISFLRGPGTYNQAVAVLPLKRQLVSFEVDGASVKDSPVAIDDSVRNHLAVYRGQLKPRFSQTDPLGSKVAAYIEFGGGKLLVERMTQRHYRVPRYDGTLADTTVAVTLAWSIPFEETVRITMRGTELMAGASSTRRILFKPEEEELSLRVVNEEAHQLFYPRALPEGGVDDHDFAIYGDSIQDGQGTALSAIVDPLVPAGRRACGAGGIQS